MLILRTKIALNAVMCMILFIFSLIMSHDYSETSDLIVRFFCFILKWLDCKIKQHSIYITIFYYNENCHFFDFEL